MDLGGHASYPKSSRRVVQPDAIEPSNPSIWQLCGAVELARNLPPMAHMFQISLAEHVRLSFGGALAAYEGHVQAAARLARWNSHARIGLLVLAGVTAGVAARAVQGGYRWQVAAAALAAAVFASCAGYVGLNRQPLIHGHRSSAAKLWVICEKYRALLAEMHEDLIDLPTLQSRRSALVSESAAVLEQSAPDDRYTYEIARQALAGPQGGGYPDVLIDRYLPEALKKQAP